MSTLLAGLAVLLLAAICWPWAQDTLDELIEDFFDDLG